MDRGLCIGRGTARQLCCHPAGDLQGPSDRTYSPQRNGTKTWVFFHMLAVICNILWASNTPYWIPVVIICYPDSALCPPTDVLLLANPVYFLAASIFYTSLFSAAGTIFTVLPNFLFLPVFYCPNSQPGHAKSCFLARSTFAIHVSMLILCVQDAEGGTSKIQLELFIISSLHTLH